MLVHRLLVADETDLARLGIDGGALALDDVHRFAVKSSTAWAGLPSFSAMRPRSNRTTPVEVAVLLRLRDAEQFVVLGLGLADPPGLEQCLVVNELTRQVLPYPQALSPLVSPTDEGIRHALGERIEQVVLVLFHRVERLGVVLERQINLGKPDAFVAF